MVLGVFLIIVFTTIAFAENGLVFTTQPVTQPDSNYATIPSTSVATTTASTGPQLPAQGGSNTTQQPVTLPAVSIAVASVTMTAPIGVYLSATLNSADKDRAGPWNTFSQGNGRIYGGKEDWEWALYLDLDTPRTIKSSSVIHNRLESAAYGEAWSTSIKDIWGKPPYPLVVEVVDNNRQLNTAYDQEIGLFGAGPHKFLLYGQTEMPVFYGAELRVEFADGNYAWVQIPSSSINSSTGTTTNTNKMTIEYYADFECPYCDTFYLEIKPLIEKFYGDRVTIVYKHMPLVALHPNSQKTAEAAECARDQGAFEEYAKMLYNNQTKLDVSSLKTYASELWLNTSTFNRCLDNGEKVSKIKQDYDEGISRGVVGTPSFVFNVSGQTTRKIVLGVQTFENFKSIIDTQLGTSLRLPAITLPSIPTSSLVGTSVATTTTTTTTSVGTPAERGSTSTGQQGNAQPLVPICNEGDTGNYICPDGTKVQWCSCIGSTWRCISSPVSNCIPQIQNTCTGCTYDDKCIARG